MGGWTVIYRGFREKHLTRLSEASGGDRLYSEKRIIGAGTDYPLKGLLTFPDDLSGPVPAVVMVHGSGGDETDTL